MPPITLTELASGFNNPIGIDYHEPTDRVLMSVNYPSGTPINFQLVGHRGPGTRFGGISGFRDEVKVATVRSGSHRGGFAVGEVFTGNGLAGQIVRISPDGSAWDDPWVELPDEPGLLRGGLFQDRYGVFGGDLIVVTTAGGVWRVTSGGIPTQLAEIRLDGVGVHLEGVTTVPDLPERYGPWAGKVVIGAEQQGQIHTVDGKGNTEIFSIGVAPEDIEIIPAGQNFFGVDFGARRLLGAPASAFVGMAGDFLIPQETPGILWHVRWDVASQAFQAEQIAQAGHWEHVTFAPSGVAPIGGSVMWINHLVLLSGDHSVATSHNASNSGVGGGLSGLVIGSSTTGDQADGGGHKQVWRALQVPPGHEVTGVRVCYELSDPRSYISGIMVDQVQNPPATTVARLEDVTGWTDPGPVCVSSAPASIDPTLGPLHIRLRLNFGDTDDRIVIRGLGLRLQPSP